MSDDELRAWQADWQRERPDLAALHARARRDDRRHRWLAVAEYAGMASLLGASLALALWRDTPTTWTWLAALWLLGLPSLVFSWWNRRGLWGGDGRSAQQHVQLSLQRCERGLRALRVGYVLLCASCAVVVLFAVGLLGAGEATDRRMLAWLAVFACVHLAVMLAMHVRLRRRRTALRRLAHEGDDTPA